MNSMVKRRIAGILWVLCALTAPGAAWAEVLGATGSASTTTLFANRDNPVTISWQVTTTTTYLSFAARVVNTVPQLTVAGALAAPQSTDQMIFTAAQVKGWLEQGLRVIVVRREFQEHRGAPARGADVRFSLASIGLRATREESRFVVQRLQLSFPNQTSLAVVEPGAALRPYLDVNYSGSGVLEGTWQVAEPGSSEGLPIYRTLRLEKRSLTGAQHTRIEGPALATGKPGRYLLRFCVIDRSDDQADAAFDCPDLKVEAAYQVLTGAAATPERIRIAPASAQVTAATEFSWSGVATAVVYQLQIYRQEKPLGDPVFVAGMLLPQQPLQTTLSPLLLDKLVPGQTYQWRINGLDALGQVVGQSALSVFAYAGP